MKVLWPMAEKKKKKQIESNSNKVFKGRDVDISDLWVT